MEKLFYKKSTATIFVAAILVLVLLVCMLLVTLTQMSSLKARADALVELIEEAKHDEEKQRQLIEEIQSNDYVRRWAEEHDRISDEDIIWINELTSSK